MEGTILKDNTVAHRLELLANDKLVGTAHYQISGNTMTITHTEVLDEYKGKGYGNELARLALNDLRRNQMKLNPACRFIASFVRKHPQYADLTRP
ncbi:hypothetical protein EDC30_101313 [Paucimonas lemoignei]|uniref:N-acetyltransferase domain-containing protein n=1 Tax=Paucimonas lemoignei TaxID=29443 RepID=A0A4R3I0W7_PAULE|nr:GNAT family N-acetyltransferase [Paucimonas lemoignei]TCS39357.1 hypothetical protein EDC30_101313 [Paucimonas lemoignei]